MSNMEAEMTCMRLNTTHEQLSCLNGVKARLYMPVTVFLGLLIVVGTLGNITVCLVYGRRLVRVSSHYFILSLAVLDLITCVIGMPTEMADLILPLTFDSPIACKVLRFVHSSTIIASSTILIEVAFDRYFRICKLGRQFTANKARLLCFGALLFGVIFSWPSCVLFGKKTVFIRVYGYSVKGTDCSTDDSMRETIWPTIYYLFLFSLFGITLAFFTVLYAKIGLRIVVQNKMRAGCGGAAGRGRGSGHRRVAVGHAENSSGDSGGSLSPQEKLAQVLRSGMNREMETPSSDLSSDPSSICQRHSSASGTSGSSGASGTSGSSGASSSSGSSGSSCSSTKPLLKPMPFSSSSSTKETNHCNYSKDKYSNTASINSNNNNNNNNSNNNGNNNNNNNNTMARDHIQRSSGSVLDNLQVPTTIHEKSRVQILASSLQPIQPYRYRNRSKENLPDSENGASNYNNINNDVQPAHDNIIVPIANNTINVMADSYNDRENVNDNEISSKDILHINKKQKRLRRKFNTKSLSCCCSCERNEQNPNSRSKEILADYDSSHDQNFDDNTLPRKRKHQPPTTPTTTHHRTCNRQLRVGKTTTVLFSVTLAYILSFLPYLTVMVMRSVIQDLEESLSPMGELAYKLCVKSFFINNAINPIIYSFLNHSFRQDVSRLFRRMCRKRGARASGSNPAASIS